MGLNVGIRAIVRLTVGFAFAVLASGLHADDNFIIVQSTTSTQNSGLFDHVLPKFTEKTGIEVRVVAVGTGQALKNARNGDGDVVLVHSKPDEEKFVAEGWGVKRHDVMYNDFVIVGPASDPAGIAGLKEADEAFKKIAEAKAPFASRGDDSGTYKEELRLWQAAGIDAKKASGEWYLETGSGMGATLNTAVGKQAYTLTDRGTWLSFANKGDFDVLVQGDPKLFNQYGVILVNPEKHPNVKAKEGQVFIDWLLSDEGQAAIASYKIDGKQLFFPNAKPLDRRLPDPEVCVGAECPR
jgi:tungstate transport system substrate-binding protein